ncbi:MAG: HAMP domain-containing histidine kinase [Actinomycetota bacterium]|nr:HAMP domain-containing histidine kinase [Actinomycetota bacterium]
MAVARKAPLSRRIGFRARLSVLAAAAVGLAIALSAVASYLFVSHQLYNQVDSALRTDVSSLNPRAYVDGTVNLDHAAGAVARRGNVVQFISSTGGVQPAVIGSSTVRVGSTDRAVATAAVNGPTGDVDTDGVIHDLRSGGLHYRVVTVALGSSPTGEGVAVEVAHPLTEVDHTLAVLKLVLLIVALCGVALAVGLGYLVARTTIRPVVRLTRAAEHVAATQDLEATIDEDGNDELSRLAHAFNGMLGALGASRHQQAQLVSDAGHELRTPLTSLRTNIEVLMRVHDLPEYDRAELLSDVKAQLEELTTLIGDVVELARQDERQPEPTEVRLDEIVRRAIDRAQRRAPALPFSVSLTPGSVRAQPAMLERAVLNVLDNAAKWSPPESTVDVHLARLDRWLLDIRDRGPGIAETDRPKVFDRFYRAETARSMPGSGLGLAIVRQVVSSHGGTVSIGTPADGGTVVHIELPIVPETEPYDPRWPASTDAGNGTGTAQPGPDGASPGDGQPGPGDGDAPPVGDVGAWSGT